MGTCTVAMSALRGDPEVHTLSASYPAVPESVPLARRALVEFVEAIGAKREQIDALRLAASEAITNAVRHAYWHGEGFVHVTAAVTGDELWLLVADDGRGLSTATHSPGLGVGMALMASLSDHFSVVSRSGGGTEVQMRFPLARVARRLSAAQNPELARRLDLSGRLRGFGAQPRGSVCSATAPASSRFSTTR